MWDYDGTLVDTRAADVRTVAQLVAAEADAAAGAASFWGSEGRPIRERLELAWPGRGAELVRRFDGADPPPVQPGVVPVLEELRRRGMRLGVVSSRRLEPLLRGLAAAGLDPFFSVVVGLDTVHQPKPDPEGMLIALDRLGVLPSRAVVVGDQDCDMEAAHRAGATGWRAGWLRTPAAGPTDEEALATPAQVLRRLDGAPAPAG